MRAGWSRRARERERLVQPGSGAALHHADLAEITASASISTSIAGLPMSRGSPRPSRWPRAGCVREDFCRARAGSAPSWPMSVTIDAGADDVAPPGPGARASAAAMLASGLARLRVGVAGADEPFRSGPVAVVPATRDAAADPNSRGASSRRRSASRARRCRSWFVPSRYCIRRADRVLCGHTRRQGQRLTVFMSPAG